jgi:anti-anti-sigma factor
MSINVRQAADGKQVTIRIAGRFDFATQRAFFDAFQQFAKGEKAFVVDLADTEYMDSSAMGMLLQLREHSHQGGDRVVLSNGNSGIREILRIANFDQLFTIV